MQTSATDVFVSYKAEDRPRVKPLVSALEAEGFSVWWDAHVGGGTHWREDIEEHLNAAKCVVVTWTKRSVGREGDFVRDEASRAQRRGVYLPICLDAVDPPLGFGEVQAVSLRGWRGDRSDPRFLTFADAVRGCVTGERYARRPVSGKQGRLSRRTAVMGGAAVGAAAIVGAGGWFLRKPGVANAKRIAVLPFANLSGGADQAYFGEGIAEELRGALSRIGLEVIGRASSDAVKDMDTRAAAAKLSVANILTGSVRRSPDMVRISAQLLDGSDGSERWSGDTAMRSRSRRTSPRMWCRRSALRWVLRCAQLSRSAARPIPLLKTSSFRRCRHTHGQRVSTNFAELSHWRRQPSSAIHATPAPME